MNGVNLSIDLGRIRRILAKNIPWSPLDFIKGISEEGDKSIFVDRITSELDQSNDLRFIYRLDDRDELAIFAEKLPWDSEFFGYGVGKINGIFPLSDPYYRPYADYTRGIDALIKLSKEKGIKYLFANVDSRDLALIQSMGKLGFSLIETRLAYQRDIRNYEYKERFPVRIAKEEDIESLGSAAITMVNMYDRFHSDPFISKKDADRLMYKWVEASIKEGFADITMVPDFKKPTAFVTVKFHKNNWGKWGIKIVQPILSAVGNEYKGWYRKIISEINYYSSGLGVEHCYVTTQVTNYGVLWVWETLGFHFGRCEHVFRIIL
jgi:dTDP-4-amino-4,6-dideoxy-D-galactose acyltransferase